MRKSDVSITKCIVLFVQKMLDAAILPHIIQYFQLTGILRLQIVEQFRRGGIAGSSEVDVPCHCLAVSDKQCCLRVTL
jgi:hypothetical protein